MFGKVVCFLKRVSKPFENFIGYRKDKKIPFWMTMVTENIANILEHLQALTS